MKKISLLLRVLGIFFAVTGFAECKRYLTVIAPKSIRSNSVYRLSVSVASDITAPINVNIKLTHRADQDQQSVQENELVKPELINVLDSSDAYCYSRQNNGFWPPLSDGISKETGNNTTVIWIKEKTILVFPEKSELVKFKTTDILPGSYLLEITSLNSSFPFYKLIFLYREAYTFSVLIQTDKALYKPGDIVSFRILVLDSKTRPIHFDADLTVALRDSKQKRVEIWSSVNAEHGVYENNYQLAEHGNLELGLWQLEVEFKDKLIKKTIEVAEYVLPTFNVKINSSKWLHVHVKATYPSGKPVIGYVIIKAIPVIACSGTWKKLDRAVVKTFNLTSGTDVVFDRSDFPSKTFESILIEVSVQENATGVIVRSTFVFNKRNLKNELKHTFEQHPKFQVIVHSLQCMHVKVFATYPTGKPVQGIAKIRVVPIVFALNGTKELSQAIFQNASIIGETDVEYDRNAFVAPYFNSIRFETSVQEATTGIIVRGMDIIVSLTKNRNFFEVIYEQSSKFQIQVFTLKLMKIRVSATYPKGTPVDGTVIVTAIPIFSTGSTKLQDAVVKTVRFVGETEVVFVRDDFGDHKFETIKYEVSVKEATTDIMIHARDVIVSLEQSQTNLVVTQQQQPRFQVQVHTPKCMLVLINATYLTGKPVFGTVTVTVTPIFSITADLLEKGEPVIKSTNCTGEAAVMFSRNDFVNPYFNSAKIEVSVQETLTGVIVRGMLDIIKTVGKPKNMLEITYEQQPQFQVQTYSPKEMRVLVNATYPTVKPVNGTVHFRATPVFYTTSELKEPEEAVVKTSTILGVAEVEFYQHEFPINKLKAIRVEISVQETKTGVVVRAKDVIIPMKKTNTDLDFIYEQEPQVQVQVYTPSCLHIHVNATYSNTGRPVEGIATVKIIPMVSTSTNFKQMREVHVKTVCFVGATEVVFGRNDFKSPYFNSKKVEVSVMERRTGRVVHGMDIIVILGKPANKFDVTYEQTPRFQVQVHTLKKMQVHVNATYPTGKPVHGIAIFRALPISSSPNDSKEIFGEALVKTISCFGEAEVMFDCSLFTSSKFRSFKVEVTVQEAETGIEVRGLDVIISLEEQITELQEIFEQQPKFQVQVNTPKCLHVRVNATYLTGQLVDGVVIVQITPIFSVSSNTTEMGRTVVKSEEIFGVTELVFARNDFSDPYFNSVKIEVSVREKRTGDVESGINIIKTLRKPVSKVGLKFEQPVLFQVQAHTTSTFHVNVNATYPTGKPVNGTAIVRAIPIVGNKLGRAIIKTASCIGVANVSFDCSDFKSTTFDLAKFEVSVQETTTNVVVSSIDILAWSHCQSLPPLLAKVINQPNLHKHVKIKVTSSQKLSTLFYYVVGRGQVLLSNAKRSDDVFKTVIELKPTASMAPESQFVVFYIGANGKIISTFCTLKFLDQYSFNFIHLDVSENKLKPGEPVDITIKTNPNSYVGLFAVDIRSRNWPCNDITKYRLYQELRSFENYGQIPLEQGLSKSIKQMVELGTFIATNADLHVASTNEIDGTFLAMPKHRQFNDNFLTDEESSELEESSETRGTKVHSQRNVFPESWLWQNITTSKDITVITVNVPDSITNWRMTAFSINELGFALTEQPIILKVSQKFYVSLSLPYSAKRDQVLDVPILVHNYYKTASGPIKLTFPNRDNHFEVLEIGTFESLHNDPNVVITSLKIIPKHIGHITIKVRAESFDVGSDTVSQDVLIEAEEPEKRIPKKD